jgi:hypothetical protein
MCHELCSVRPGVWCGQATARRSVWKRATNHLEHMLSRAQRIDHSGGARSKWGKGHPRLRDKAGRLEFSLEIMQGHVEIAHGHFWRSAQVFPQPGQRPRRMPIQS